MNIWFNISEDILQTVKKIALRAGSERGFSALSQNVFAYVWKRSLNLLMLRNLYIEIIMRTFEKCHCTVTHSSDRLYQQNLRMILSALQSMWLLMQRLKSWQQRLRLWTLRTVNKIECIERLFTRKSVISLSTLFKNEESSSCARLNRTWAWQIVIKFTSVRFIIWCLSEINSQSICFCQFISEVLKVKQSFMTWLRFARTMIE